MQFLQELTGWFHGLPIAAGLSLAYIQLALEIIGALCICFLHGFGLFYHEPRSGKKLSAIFHMQLQIIGIFICSR